MFYSRTSLVKYSLFFNAYKHNNISVSMQQIFHAYATNRAKLS